MLLASLAAVDMGPRSGSFSAPREAKLDLFFLLIYKFENEMKWFKSFAHPQSSANVKPHEEAQPIGEPSRGAFESLGYRIW